MLLTHEFQEIDLIVISAHGRTGIGHLFIGSVAEHVVRYALCPVLVIPTRPVGFQLSSPNHK